MNEKDIVKFNYSGDALKDGRLNKCLNQKYSFSDGIYFDNF